MDAALNNKLAELLGAYAVEERQMVKELIQQEIAKARIDELTGVLTANNQPKLVPLNLKPRGMMEIRDRITELSATPKEHKEK